MTAHLLAREAVELVGDRSRAILGIAGCPGAGKSTLVDLLVTRIRAAEGDDWVAHVPMDGFHLADAQLDRIGARGRKGAPDTFDVGRLRASARAGEAGGRRAGVCAGLRPHAGTAARGGACRAAVGAPRRHRGQLSAPRRSRLGTRPSRDGRRVVRRQATRASESRGSSRATSNSARPPMRHAPGSRPPTSATPNWWRAQPAGPTG